jgi:hypothetical protein
MDREQVASSLGKPLVVVVAALALAMGGWILTARAESGVPLAGTYSSMFYNGESGDINGDEIRIVATRKGFQGTIQFGRGEPTELVLIKPTIDGSGHVTFDFIDPSSEAHVTFSGKVTASGLEGRLFGDVYRLKRAPSYWDTWRTDPP